MCGFYNYISMQLIFCSGDVDTLYLFINLYIQLLNFRAEVTSLYSSDCLRIYWTQRHSSNLQSSFVCVLITSIAESCYHLEEIVILSIFSKIELGGLNVESGMP